MANPHGSFIWYELLTPDVDAAQAFYEKIVGWSVAGFAGAPMDYRIASAPDGTGVGGIMASPTGPEGENLRPGWFGYVGVDDVDASVAATTAAGGSVLVPAMDMEGVGRMAMLADPQGAVFQVMRGASPDDSKAYDPEAVGHCNWNELNTSDQDAAFAFYAGDFGWTKGEAMEMGPMGIYQMLDLGGRSFGAMMTAPNGMPPSWTFYFGVPDIDAAHRAIADGGGNVHHGPAEIPGGSYIVIAGDPHGATFGVVGPRK